MKLLNHKTLGGYFIHVGADGKLVAHHRQCTRHAAAAERPDHGYRRLSRIGCGGGTAALPPKPLPVRPWWSSAGGQDDLTWYKGENIGGAWVAAANLAANNSTGTYFIHVYAGNKLVAHTTVTVESLPNG